MAKHKIKLTSGVNPGGPYFLGLCVLCKKEVKIQKSMFEEFSSLSINREILEKYSFECMGSEC